jgi:hypothetical protein
MNPDPRRFSIYAMPSAGELFYLQDRLARDPSNALLHHLDDARTKHIFAGYLTLESLRSQDPTVVAIQWVGGLRRSGAAYFRPNIEAGVSGVGVTPDRLIEANGIPVLL